MKEPNTMNMKRNGQKNLQQLIRQYLRMIPSSVDTTGTRWAALQSTSARKACFAHLDWPHLAGRT